MLADCDDPLAVQKLCSMLPAFEFEARPVIPIDEAVRSELEVMAWRDKLQFAEARLLPSNYVMTMRWRAEGRQ